MNSFSRYWMSRPLAFGVLLAALTLRALIPSGYMPSSGQPLVLQLCRVGLPAGAQHALASSTDPGAPSQNVADPGLCSFGLSTGAAPAPQQLTFSLPTFAVEAPAAAPELPILQPRRHAARQPRAPPAFS